MSMITYDPSMVKFFNSTFFRPNELLIEKRRWLAEKCFSPPNVIDKTRRANAIARDRIKILYLGPKKHMHMSSSEPTHLQTFAQFGTYAQVYLTAQSILHTNFSQLSASNAKWNRLVRTQVYRINDPRLDLDAAYDLMEKQRHLCKRCASHLTLDRNPIVVKFTRHYHFLGLHNIETKFSWVCSACSGDNFEETLHDKIARLVKEEEEKEMEQIDERKLK